MADKEEREIMKNVKNKLEASMLNNNAPPPQKKKRMMKRRWKY